MELSALLNSAGALPSIPKVVALLLAELDRPEPDSRKVADLIGSDPALTTRVLKLVNSALFALPRKVSDVPAALSLLGYAHIRSLVMAAALGSAFRSVPGMKLDQFWRYSLNTGKIARALAAQLKNDAGAAMTAGLIHMVGELVIHLGMPVEAVKLSAVIAPLQPKRARAENRFFGFNYADVGAGFAGRWQFPQPIVDAMQHQLAPFDSGVYEPLAGIVQLAAWRSRAHELQYDNGQLAVTFPDTTGLALGLDIDMVLVHDPADWSASGEVGAFVA